MSERLAHQGDPEEAGRLLRELVRAGALPRNRLEVLASIHYPPAVAALGGKVAAPSSAADDAELVAFRRVLAQTVAWCSESRGSRAYRTPALSLGGADWEDPDGWNGLAEEHEAASSAVLALTGRRERLLAADGWIPDALAFGLGNGRLLGCIPDQSLFDGAAEAASEGFFDFNNLPAWDTWVTMIRSPVEGFSGDCSCLVSWVPPDRVRDVARGIDVNPEGCIDWLENLCEPFSRKLQAARLLPDRLAS